MTDLTTRLFPFKAFPNAEERVNNPIPATELDELLKDAYTMLNVHPNEYDESIRHIVVKETLLKHLPKERGVQNLPLAVKRRTDNPAYVTWSGANTVLGDAVKSSNFTLKAEMRVTKLLTDPLDPGKVWGCLVRDLGKDADVLVIAHVRCPADRSSLITHVFLWQAYVIACGAVGTPQILANSGLGGPALGKHLSEQSIAFCQVRATFLYILNATAGLTAHLRFVNIDRPQARDRRIHPH